MEQINSLILYRDWLMLTRGKIEPRVGDKVQTIAEDCTTWINGIITIFGKRISEITTNNINYCVSNDCIYVEVPYPVIEWGEKKQTNPNYMNAIIATHIAYIGKLPLDMNIEEYDNDEDSVLNYDDIIFEGTVFECKQQANKLLYGTTK